MAKKEAPIIDITKEQIKQIETYAAVLNIDQMADLLGFDRGDFKKELSRRPDVLKVYRQARTKEIAGIAMSMIIAARNGCRHRQQLFLERIAGWQIGCDEAAPVEEKRRSLDEWYNAFEMISDIDTKNKANNG